MKVSVSQAIQNIKSNSRIFIHGGAAAPQVLLNELFKRKDLENIELIHLHIEGDIPYSNPEFRKKFKVKNLFVGANVRPTLNYNEIDYLPIFLSEIPQLFDSKKMPIDVALIHVSNPDQHGDYSLGISCDVALSAVKNAKMVIAQSNTQMPRVHGDGFIHESKINYLVEVNEPLFEHLPTQITETEKNIGKRIAELIEDGATLQTGIGSIPDAVLSQLQGHKNLGLHTEMWSDHALELILKGVINNTQKKVHPGKSVSTFMMGSRKLYDFVNDNLSVIQLPADYVNSPNIIARNPKVVAINSAVEVDLTGQVCADSIGHKIISGVGGQMDFMRGASLSKGGKPIIAITSRTKNGKSRIVSALKAGAGVVTTRSHVHYVVTENGVADLFGKTLYERANALIKIAHPEDQESLEREWKSSHL